MVLFLLLVNKLYLFDAPYIFLRTRCLFLDVKYQGRDFLLRWIEAKYFQ